MVPGKGLRRHHFPHQIAADDVWTGLRLVHERGIVRVLGREHTGHRPADAQPPHQGAGVDAFHAQDLVLTQIGVEVAQGPEVARDPRELADNETFNLWPARFRVFGIGPVVADERIGHRDQLSPVRRIGQHLLVTGHARIENDLAEGLAPRAEAAPGIDRAVLESKLCDDIIH